MFSCGIAYDGNVNSFRQNIQVEYTKRLIAMVTGTKSKLYVSSAQSMAIYNLQQIQKMSSSSVGDVSTKAHSSHLKTLIANALKEIK